MKYVRLRMAPIVLLCSLAAICAEPAPSRGEEAAAKVPRNIRFITTDEPFVAEVRDEPFKEDFHFAAVVRGFAPLLLQDASGGGNTELKLPINANALVNMAQIDPSASGVRLRKLLETRAPAWTSFRAEFVYHYDPALAPLGGRHVTPKGDLSNIIGMLNSMANPADAYLWRHFTPAREMDRQPLQQYALLAPSAEEAKQLAQGFLHAYDEGLVPWLEKLFKEQAAALKTERDEAAPKLAALETKIAAAKREVEGVEPLGSSAANSDLQVKRTLLKVELAGVKARVASIEAKMKEKGTTKELRDKLADLKVNADIDLASLAAQQQVLDELIDGQRRLRQINELRSEMGPYAQQIKTADEGLPRCEEILADLKPFQLIDETVVIRPLRFHVE